MTNFQVTALGAFVHGAVYLVCVFLAGFWTGDLWAWRMALVGMGFAYLSQLVDGMVETGMVSPPAVAFPITVAIAAGVGAGVMLLV